MKISQSLLFAFAAAQGEDRWGSTDYYSFNYGFGGKQDSGVAFGLNENPQTNPWDNTSTGLTNQWALAQSYEFNAGSAHTADNLHFNGLLCWMCDFRLDLATEAESTTCNGTTCQNAYARCLKNGMLMRCRGEQRTCMFEERRRHGVVYSVCTGCKQTDACVAHWRRNQRFTLPFMNFGDMSLRNLPTETGNVLDGTKDQLPNHRPIYVDDECSTYQETRTEAAWRKTVYNPVPGTSGGDLSNTVANLGTNNEVFPMGWIPHYNDAGVAHVLSPAAGNQRLTNGLPFSGYTGSALTIANDLQFTGHRVNLGLSYSKFAYDGGNDLQLNAQLSQWESTCRWCCHARPDTVCNIEMKTINSSPFSTKCGNVEGTRRDDDVAHTSDANPGGATNNKHPIAPIIDDLYERITTAATALQTNNQLGYWELLDHSSTDSITYRVNAAFATYACSLSNAQWSNSATAAVLLKNQSKYPLGIHNKFRFFQPFNIAQSNSDYFNGDQFTCASGASEGAYCTAATSTADCGAVGLCTITGAYERGPRFWMQMFQRTPQYDLSAYYGLSLRFDAKFPSTGEGRNSAGMDKFAGRGNKSRWQTGTDRATIQNNPELQHFFQQQTDMVSQENRDFFDARAKDSATQLAPGNIYLKRYDNSVFWNQNRK